MSATIYSFPSKTDEDKHVYSLSLYGDLEIETVLTCVNVFSILDYKVTHFNLQELDPRFVVHCLEAGKKSWIFSDTFKKIIDSIINNMQVT